MPLRSCYTNLAELEATISTCHTVAASIPFNVNLARRALLCFLFDPNFRKILRIRSILNEIKDFLQFSIMLFIPPFGAIKVTL